MILRMKKIYSIFTLVVLLAFTACQQDEALFEVGYLKLEVGTNAYVNPSTRIIDEYNPKQIAVQVLDANNSVMKETDDWETLKGKQIRLAPGVYTVKASSNGFDGSEAHFDTPYYVGSETVTIEKGVVATANITCTLANVKVTVNYDQTFIDAFQSATATVTSSAAEGQPLEYVMGTDLKSGYFPVGELTANIAVVNKAGESHDKDYSIKHADGSAIAARDHFILNFKVAESGSVEGTDKPGITVTVDGTEVIYTFEFNVSTEPTVQLETSLPNYNIWSSFVYLNGAITAWDHELDPDYISFEYKQSSASEWNTLDAETVSDSDGKKFTATLNGLTANTEYEYRMVYKKGDDEAVSGTSKFTTDTENKIPNLGFDNWYQNGSKNTYYACTEADFSTNKFWDSGNEGANTLKEVNPTREWTEKVISGSAAYLGSTEAASQFAAASLFTGDFKKATLIPLGAQLDFGQPFTERPTQLTGYYMYNPGSITHTEVSGISKGDRDICSIYILLADWSAPFAVSTGDDQFVDITDSSIIAYGELSSDKTSPESMSEYEKFTIDIKYRDLTRKPTYILLVCSASKYGDYFTGSTNSVLLLDEFDLIYGEPTLDPDYQ